MTSSEVPNHPRSVAEILSDRETSLIVLHYDAEEMGKLLREALPPLYPPGAPYVVAIEGALYPEFASTCTSGPLAADDRERCLVALLAMRGERLELAIHIYLAIANGVSPAEVAHILLLTAVYAGIPAFPKSLEVEVQTLLTLKRMIDSGEPATPRQVYAALRIVFAR
jgi:alkylhydroperoxidase/carboxymuconolactone decarboxylase family protein YurZ